MHELDEIASRSVAAVRGGEPGVQDLSRRAEQRHNRRQQVVGVAGTALLFAALIGGWLLAQPSDTSIDTADGRTGLNGEILLPFDPLSEVPAQWDVVIFLKAEATADDVEAVRLVIADDPAISDFVWWSQDQMYAEFVDTFSDDPELLDTISVNTMPTSFRIATENPQAPVFALLAEEHADVVRQIIGPDSELPQPITAFGSPIFDRRAADTLFIASRAGYDEAFRRCMADKGFESLEPLTATGWKPEQYLADIGVTLQQRVLNDLKFAESWGFAIATTADFVGPRPDHPEGIDEDDPYYKAAFGGLFGGGCEEESADVWLDGDREVSRNWEDIVEARDAFAADPRVAAHYEPWSRCMSGEGYEVRSPLDAERQSEDAFLAFKRDGGDRDLLVADERSLARAVVGCGGSSSSLVSLQLAVVWQDYAQSGWNEDRYRANDPDCLIEGHLVGAKLLAELATLDRVVPDVERCFGGDEVGDEIVATTTVVPVEAG